MNEPDPDNACFFTVKPTLFSGKFFFYFGPWDRWPALREWYLAHGLTDVHDRIKDYHPDSTVSSSDHYDGQVINPCPGFPIVMMKAIPHTPHEIGSLVHEIHHAVQRWTEGIGIFTARESEEVFAYVEGNLTAVVLDYIWHGTVAAGMEPGLDHWKQI